MKRKRHLPGICMLLLLLCTGGTIYGMTSVSVINRFETGKVEIRLEEYQKNGENETLWKDLPVILPGDEISKIPRITNEGNTCYIRARILFDEMEGMDEQCLIGINEDWVKAADGYYYYTKILQKEESVDLFQGLKIPSDFSQEHQQKKLSLKIVADAIQSQNFVPEFQSKYPWGTVSVVETAKNGDFEMNSVEKSSPQLLQIVYEGESARLITNCEDFFENFHEWMPGDRYSDTIQIINTGEEDIKLYFQSTVYEENELLNQVRLVIEETGSEVSPVYVGDLRAEKLQENIILGTVPKNSERTLRFEVSVPTELNNFYSMQKGAVQWCFSTEPIKHVFIGNVQTGDSLKPMMWFGICGIALCALCLAGVNYFKANKGEEDE